MENDNCVKCGDCGCTRTITMDDGEMTSKIGAIFCNECYGSLFECVVEMVYEDQA